MSLFQWFPGVKTALRGLFFRTGWYSDDHGELERIYQSFEDPWNIESSEYEQDRLDIVLDTVRRYPHRSMLEVGCAEGKFTCRLAELGSRIMAIDVSETAIARARKRCSAPRYIRSSLEEFDSNELFDLVICSETLYYMSDVKQALVKLSQLGRFCLVSYIEREAKRLDQYFEGLELEEFKRYEKTYGVIKRAMTVVVWSNGRAH